MFVSQQLSDFISTLATCTIPKERQIILSELIQYIQEAVDKNLSLRLNFICTHNSRRSHLAQVWAQTIAYKFGVKNCYCYSGGTESTCIYQSIMETLAYTGFHINKLSENNNPIYSIKYAANEPAIIAFSKEWNNSFNPSSGFAAVVTCAEAAKDCPLIIGAEKRIAITYDDPKAFDDSWQQAAKYNERSKQIAAEMYYVFSMIKHD